MYFEKRLQNIKVFQKYRFYGYLILPFFYSTSKSNQKSSENVFVSIYKENTFKDIL